VALHAIVIVSARQVYAGAGIRSVFGQVSERPDLIEAAEGLRIFDHAFEGFQYVGGQ